MKAALSLSLGSTLFAALALATPASAQFPPGELPALGLDRIEQSEIEGGLSLFEVRQAGLKIFATPFNKLDGYGDGPVDFVDPTGFGRRPTLQNNGTFLRVNGLDAQTCMECHSVGSATTAPFTFAIGGVGGSNNNAIFMPTNIDVDDEAGNGFAAFDGRYINPPFLFGSGGIELLAKEMTSDLQRLKRRAFNLGGAPVPLLSKGVDFGFISYDAQAGEFDTSAVEGVDDDLVVRPFGRKGDVPTMRAFDLDATQFHLGMQPVEVVGLDVDEDGDGVVNELLVGELSAMHVFGTNMERPVREPPTPMTNMGFNQFVNAGCTECHKPFLDTVAQELTYSFPEVLENPSANVFYAANLATGPAGFNTNLEGGVRVPLFADLKRHDMGPDLAETFGSEIDAEFTTARLWGIADTAPYLHDGRALTLTDAILMHGGEAQAARDNFDALPPMAKTRLLGFLRSLRTPVDPAVDLLP